MTISACAGAAVSSTRRRATKSFLLSLYFPAEGDWASARWNQREHAQRAARAILDLERRRKDHGARGRKLVEVAQALQAVAAAAMKEMMRRVRRIEVTGLTGVRSDRLGAEAENAAFLDKPPHHGSIRPRRMRAVILQVGVIVPALLRPVGAQQHPTTFRNTPMLLLPCFDDRDRQQKVWVLCGLRGAIKHASRSDHVAHWESVDGIVRQILARKPMDRCIEVGPGMLSEGKIVPIPSRPGLIVV